MAPHSVRRATWSELTTNDLYGIVRLRARVFGMEQHVTDEDFDGRDRDPETEHWWVPGIRGDAIGALRLIAPAADEQYPAGALRPYRVIGRVATDRNHRGTGVASALLRGVLRAHDAAAFVLHAQTHATGLYQVHGFGSFGKPYMEAGIEHVRMYRAGH